MTPPPTSPAPPPPTPSPAPAAFVPRMALWVGVATFVVALVWLLFQNGSPEVQTTLNPAPSSRPDTPEGAARDRVGAFSRRGTGAIVRDDRPPGEIVAERVTAFARKRRDTLVALAGRKGVAVPPEMLAVFEALEAGDFPLARERYGALHERRSRGELPEALQSLWPPMLEAYGAAEVAAEWPARTLLDYGNRVLGALRPDTVYLGGSDAGRFVPALLAGTGDAGTDAPIVLTQNALADRTYLDYVEFLHEGRLSTLTGRDSEEAFQSYTQDAAKRARADAANPDGARQLRPGEEVSFSPDGGRISVSGQVAVMSINEELLRRLLERNPGMSFAIEEPYPLKGLHAEAVPLGPIMELRAGDVGSEELARRAADSLAIWEDIAREPASHAAEDPNAGARHVYSDMAAAQAGLFQDRGLSAEAERAYRLALEIEPTSTRAVVQLASMLVDGGRLDEAKRVVDTALSGDGGEQGSLRALRRQLEELPPRKP